MRVTFGAEIRCCTKKASPVASATNTSAKPYWAISGSDGGAAGRGSRMRGGYSSKESDIGCYFG